MDWKVRREGLVENVLGGLEGQETRIDTYGEYDNNDGLLLMELVCQALCQISSVLLATPPR